MDRRLEFRCCVDDVYRRALHSRPILPGKREQFSSHARFAQHRQRGLVSVEPGHDRAKDPLGNVEVGLAGDRVNATPSVDVGFGGHISAMKCPQNGAGNPRGIADHQPRLRQLAEKRFPVELENVFTPQPKTMPIGPVRKSAIELLQVVRIDVDAGNAVGLWKGRGCGHQEIPATASRFENRAGPQSRASQLLADPGGQSRRRLEITEFDFDSPTSMMSDIHRS